MRCATSRGKYGTTDTSKETCINQKRYTCSLSLSSTLCLRCAMTRAKYGTRNKSNKTCTNQKRPKWIKWDIPCGLFCCIYVSLRTTNMSEETYTNERSLFWHVRCAFCRNWAISVDCLVLVCLFWFLQVSFDSYRSLLTYASCPLQGTALF